MAAAYITLSPCALLTPWEGATSPALVMSLLALLLRQSTELCVS
jgi:hypothetical protein